MESREWVNVLRGEVESNEYKVPNYKKDSLEYKILQIALDIENLIPTTIDPKYEDYFLINIPSEFHINFKARNKIYKDIKELKENGKATELDDGLLTATDSSLTSEKDLITNENNLRKELFVLIAKNLKVKDTTKNINMVSKVYSNAIKYQKHYALVEYNSSGISFKDSTVLTSMASSYSFKVILDNLISLLKDEDYIIDENKSDNASSTLMTSYTCEGKKKEKVNFVIKICSIKEKKLLNCKDNLHENLYSYVTDGAVIWVEKSKKLPTLSFSTEESEEQKLLVCKDMEFDIFEKLSEKLISSENKNVD
jgi:hypothetical protein